ncbi:unnamed protein product [Pedinophyceae sp. YPF-701]|nr:unnamed protein product [Pedinophyceae sp. YPF-701]
MADPFSEKDEVDPKIVLARKRFLLKHKDIEGVDRKKELEEAVKICEDGARTHLYSHLCKTLGLKEDAAKVKAMKEANKKKEEEIEEKKKEAEERGGDTDMRDVHLARADYLASIGDLKGAIEAYKVPSMKSMSLGQRLDSVFAVLRLAIAYDDWRLVREKLDDARALFEQGADWERKNRLKVYEAVYLLAVRRYKQACALFLDAVATFTTTELMTYRSCIRYTVLTALISLPRPELRAKVVDSPEVLSVIEHLSPLGDLLSSFYGCKYADFFVALDKVTRTLVTDTLLHTHHRWYLREIRVKAFRQYLEPFKSVRLGSMAAAFGLPEDDVDRELADLIVAGRVACKIDRVAGVVETSRPDTQNALYQRCIRQGDALLNRVQKLSKVIDLE